MTFVVKNCTLEEPLFTQANSYGILSGNGSVSGKCKMLLTSARSNRSLFPRWLSIASRARVNSLHQPWPIRSSPPACANQYAWAFLTPRWPEVISSHTAALSTWKAAFLLIHFPAIVIWGIEMWLWLFVELHFHLSVSFMARRPSLFSVMSKLAVFNARRGPLH